MSIEIQIQSIVLGKITARAVQTILFNSCFPTIGSDYVDHADVASTSVDLTSAGAAVQLRVALDLFVVSHTAVLAAPNAVPMGATAPPNRVFLLLEMAANGPVVSLRCVRVDLGSLGIKLGPGAPAAEDALCAAIGSLVKADLTEVLKQLGSPSPSSSRVELFGDIVAIRFEPVGNAVAHLFPGQEWSLFLDGDAVDQLAESQIVAKGDIASQLPIDAHWRPAGTVPHVDLEAAMTATFGAFTPQADIKIGCDFSLVPPSFSGLRTAVHWSIHVDVGTAVPAFVDKMVRKEVEKVIEITLDPAKFGATPIGDHAFAFDSPLPHISFGGAGFRYNGAVASPAGMTIGGPVQLPFDVGRDTVQPSVQQFGLPVRLTFCRDLAKTGSGDPRKIVSLGEVTTRGSVWLAPGVFCNDLEIVSPGDWIRPYITQPTGAAAENPQVRIAIPSAGALGITAPVRLIVRTSRGVRLVELGIPPPVTLDADGNVSNAQTWHIPNCLRIAVGSNSRHRIQWGTIDSDRRDPVINPDRQLRRTDWATFVGRHLGLDAHLVNLTGLEPGELIQFRSRDHSVDVTADGNGRAMVPALLSLANEPEGATLTRVNRRNVTGHFTVRTAMFQRHASYPAGRQNRLESYSDGTAVLTIEFQDRIDVRSLGSLGAMMLVNSEKARNPIPSHKAIATRRGGPLFGRTIDLPSLATVVAVPGFEEEPIALAVMRDGSTLVLDLRQEGTARVAGNFTGPIGVLDVSADWALMAEADQVSVFRVTLA